MMCLIRLVAPVNSEGVTFTGMYMKNWLHKLSCVRKGQPCYIIIMRRKITVASWMCVCVQFNYFIQ